MGDWNAICIRCNFQYKASELDKEWTGIRVCEKCLDKRHPQDFVQTKPDGSAAPWTRPQPPDVFDGTDVRGNDIGIPLTTYEANDGPGNLASGSVATTTFRDEQTVRLIKKEGG